MANELSKPEEMPGDRLFMAIFMADHLAQFSQIIQNFPEGNRACNIEIAIAGYESALTIYTKEQFPEEWANIQVNLGSTYAVRVKGNKAQNAMHKIACYEHALSVFTPEYDKEKRAFILNNLGAVYLESSQKVPEHIDKAISYFAEALRILQGHPNSPESDKAFQYLMVAGLRKDFSPTPLELEMAQAQSSRDQYVQSGDLQALQRSIAIWERIISHPDFDKADEAFRFDVLYDSGGTFIHRYHHTKNVSDLRRALSHWHELEEKVPSNSSLLVHALNGLGHYRYLYDHTRKIEHLDQAITFLQAANQIEPTRPATLYHLGITWRQRYLHNGSVSDLKSAITAYQEAIKFIAKSTSSDHGSQNIRASCYNNLGNAWRDYFDHTGEFTVLQEAITVFEQAVELSHEARPHDRALCLTNLGTGLRHRYRYTKKPQDIHQAIQRFEEAVAITPVNSPNLHLYLNNLGRGFQTRYWVTLSPVDLGEAIKYFMQAINSAPPHAENDRTVYLVNLGEALTQQSISTNNRFFWQEAKKLFRDASQKGLNVTVGETLRSMKTWLTTAFLYEEWQEVSEAYRFFYQASQQVLKIQLVRTDKETW